MTNLRFRQVHLDFHTSEQIPGIGSDFNAEEFADTLVAAHVNSVTCFSRCHHGWLYHDSKGFPERRHPHLTCNLLAEQIEACHARNVRVPIYITVRYDHCTARQHPEWLVVDENGTIIGTRPYDAGFYRELCLNSPYVDFLEQQTVEVCETLPTDGIFFDIVRATPCSCEYCKRAMVAAGLNPAEAADRKAFADQVLLRFEERMFKAVVDRQPEATVFFNGGHVGPHHRPIIHNYTHLELESLPSGGWGYMHFPVAQRFARGLGLDTMGMTGKFHTSWGDFSSFKNPAALEFECLNMLALGGKCSIGDQLHPSGQIDQETYKLIGGAYAKVEAAEPWCEGARPLVDIGLFTPEEFVGGGHGAMSPAIIGASRILQELRQQFDIIDSQSDLSNYRLVVLPDDIPVEGALAEKLEAFVAGGGAVIASYKSGLETCGCGFGLKALGLTYLGEAEYSPDFIVPDKLGTVRPGAGHVMYRPGSVVVPLAGTEVLSAMVKPYFNRTWEHFCSHRHTPLEGPVEYPGATRNGNCIYFMHPVFALYHDKAPLWCKQLVEGALQQLLPEPQVRVEGPSTLLVTINEQKSSETLALRGREGQSVAARKVVHLLHYVPERRAKEFDIIEDIIPLYELPVSVLAETANRVYLAPQGEDLPFTIVTGEGGGPNRVYFALPKLEGTQMVVVE